jgi:hypothetical protein
VRKKTHTRSRWPPYQFTSTSSQDVSERAAQSCKHPWRYMDAVAKMKDPTTQTYLCGHEYVCAILVFRARVIPGGVRLSRKPAREGNEVLFRKTTELAAQLLLEFKAPAGVEVLVMFDAYYRCRCVVQACRDQHCHFASTLKSNRSLFKQGWRVKPGRYGWNLLRRRHTEIFLIANPNGSAHYCFIDAGWLRVSTLPPLHVVFSRKGTEKILGLVTDDPATSAVQRIQAYYRCWTTEQFVKDLWSASPMPS